jgi:hypothetical protein
MVALCLYFASGLVNLLLARWTPEQLDRAVERTKPGAAVAQALAHLGLNLPGLMRLGARLLAERAAAANRGAR